MPQFLIERDAIVDGRVSLQGAEAHHVRHVLRYRAGDSIQLFDGEGRGFEGRIVGMAPGEVKILIVRERSRSPKSHLPISLVPALLPFQVMDELIRQATELGVDEIRPILCQRCVVRLDEKGVKTKHGHWEKVALSATKQCGRLELPRIHEAVKLSRWLDDFRLPETLWVAHPSRGLPSARLSSASRGVPRQGRRGLPSAAVTTPTRGVPRQGCRGLPSLGQRVTEIVGPGKRVHVLIGPEGGFTQVEIEAIRSRGGKEIYLGDLTMRSPTACLYVLSILSYLSQNS